MTIRRLLKGSKLGPQEQNGLNVAYRLTLKSLHVADRGDPLCELVARKIIEVGARGDRFTDVIAISQIALRELELSVSNDWRRRL
jgi:hypothetical protein